MVSHYGFDLHFSNNWADAHLIFYISSLGNCLFKAFAHFLISSLIADMLIGLPIFWILAPWRYVIYKFSPVTYIAFSFCSFLKNTFVYLFIYLVVSQVLVMAHGIFDLHCGKRDL